MFRFGARDAILFWALINKWVLSPDGVLISFIRKGSFQAGATNRALVTNFEDQITPLKTLKPFLQETGKIFSETKLFNTLVEYTYNSGKSQTFKGLYYNEG